MCNDTTKTTVLNEFVEFCNLSRKYLLQAKDSLRVFKDEVALDLEGYNIPQESKAVTMAKFEQRLEDIITNTIEKSIAAIDNIEDQLCAFYHADSTVNFVKKALLSKDLITQICITTPHASEDFQSLRDIA